VSVTVGYLILAHQRPGQVLRLLQTIRAQTDDPIIVHVDRKRRGIFAPFESSMCRLGRVRLMSTRRVYWADYSIVGALLDGLRVLLDDPAVTHIKHLSGQDYPIKPLALWQAKLKNAVGLSFLDHERLPYAGWGKRGGLDRIHHAFLRPFALGPRHLRVRLPGTRKLPGISFFGGSAFWCLARAHAAFALESRELQDFFRSALFADEHFFHTALLNSPFRGEVVDEELTHTIWETNAGSPRVLSSKDYGTLAASPCYFARKFDEDADAAILDSLDRDLGVT
jgi:hypothetical protein